MDVEVVPHMSKVLSGCIKATALEHTRGLLVSEKLNDETGAQSLLNLAFESCVYL